MILVVDDDANLVRIMAMRLEAAGYAVTTAHDGESALRSARENLPDLVITDVGLTDESGFELHSALVSLRGFQAPIIYLSGSSRREDHDEARDHGAADFVIKPFNFDELLDRIAQYVRPVSPVSMENRRVGQETHSPR